MQRPLVQVDAGLTTTSGRCQPTRAPDGAREVTRGDRGAGPLPSFCFSRPPRSARRPSRGLLRPFRSPRSFPPIVIEDRARRSATARAGVDPRGSDSSSASPPRSPRRFKADADCARLLCGRCRRPPARPLASRVRLARRRPDADVSRSHYPSAGVTGRGTEARAPWASRHPRPHPRGSRCLRRRPAGRGCRGRPGIPRAVSAPTREGSSRARRRMTPRAPRGAQLGKPGATSPARARRRPARIGPCQPGSVRAADWELPVASARGADTA